MNFPDNTEIIILGEAFEDLGGWKKAYHTTREKLKVPNDVDIFGPNVSKRIFNRQSFEYNLCTIYIFSNSYLDKNFLEILKAAHLAHDLSMFSCDISTWKIKKEV